MRNFLTDKEKLLQICQHYGVSMADFATKTGIKKTEIYQISGNKQLYFSRETMSLIAENCPEISLYWLITGEGGMLAGNIEHHNAVATGHSTATVNHSETDKERDGLIVSQQQTIDRLTKIIDNLTSKQ